MKNTIKLGSNINNKVYFRNELNDRYNSNNGYYGIIRDITSARNYNLLATYEIDVYDINNTNVNTIYVNWTNLTDKNI
jgi:hypothetical protein